MAITPQTSKVLFSRARDLCAYPACHVRLTSDQVNVATGESNAIVLGEQAHIRSPRPDGPRYDVDYPSEKLDSPENVILLCPTHHRMIDKDGGSGYSVDELVEMKRHHEGQQQRRSRLEQVVMAYLGDRYAADDAIQFQQVDLNAPSVDALFVDVPFSCRRDSPRADFIGLVVAEAPPDQEALEGAADLAVAGAAQALLHPQWAGNALIVGGPGQGKSTLLQYLCQFHRAKRLGHDTYTGEAQSLVRVTATPRVPIRIDLRKYAQWAYSARGESNGRTKKKRKRGTAKTDPRTLEQYIAADIAMRSGGHEFSVADLAVLVATDAVLIAFDGLDEVANPSHRDLVGAEIVQAEARLRSDAADLVVLVATRPGGTTSRLWSAAEFPRFDLRRLSQGLRLQYLQRWCAVSQLSPDQTDRLQRTFLEHQHVVHIRELASQPMQLAILLHLLYRRQLLPQQRTELYREYLMTFLDREQTEGKEPLLAERRPVIEEVHAYLGWLLQSLAESRTTAGSIARDALRTELRAHFEDDEDGQRLARELFSAFVSRVLCLVERDPGYFQFEVQSLREYFAALHIFDNAPPRGVGNTRDDCLNELLIRPYWSNVCRFFVGMLSKGEVRALVANLRNAQQRVPGLPMVRSAAALFLDDRIYEVQPSSTIREVVDLILEGPGVVLAEDGLLDTSGAALALSEKAGRSQAVDHLMERMMVETDPGVRRSAAASLLRHVGDEVDLAGWWWGEHRSDATWIESAADLFLFAEVRTDQRRPLCDAIRGYTSDTTWATELLVRGGYVDGDDRLLAVVVDELNDGAWGAVHDLGDGDLGKIISAAAGALARVRRKPALGERTRRARTRQRTGSNVSVVLGAGDTVPAVPPDASSSGEWSERLARISSAWGDGWVLWQAVATTPREIDLNAMAVVISARDAVLARVLNRVADLRQHLDDPGWWTDWHGSCSSEKERRFWGACMIASARSSVIVALSDQLGSAVDAMAPKHYEALRAELTELGRSVGPLDLTDDLRLRQADLTPRLLWLLRHVSTERTRRQIDNRLAVDPTAVLHRAVGDYREFARVVGSVRTLKVDTLRGARAVLPTGGWASDIKLGSMRAKIASEIVADPAQWPADIVQRAIDQLAAGFARSTPPLAEVAEHDRWFRADKL
ncbi:HNH endonuclease [Ruania rhizosphaerae]|uniref:HNH endonuclease n=1 Tax=Ruania rhizosphaerae TaxID=1840413 RepID=UPI001359B22C|nr:HNH endonuclease [Ruania rhizosphaerae]